MALAIILIIFCVPIGAQNILTSFTNKDNLAAACTKTGTFSPIFETSKRKCKAAYLNLDVRTKLGDRYAQLAAASRQIRNMDSQFNNAVTKCMNTFLQVDKAKIRTQSRIFQLLRGQSTSTDDNAWLQWQCVQKHIRSGMQMLNRNNIGGLVTRNNLYNEVRKSKFGGGSGGGTSTSRSVLLQQLLGRSGSRNQLNNLLQNNPNSGSNLFGRQSNANTNRNIPETRNVGSGSSGAIPSFLGGGSTSQQVAPLSSAGRLPSFLGAEEKTSGGSGLNELFRGSSPDVHTLARPSNPQPGSTGIGNLSPYGSGQLPSNVGSQPPYSPPVAVIPPSYPNSGGLNNYNGGYQQGPTGIGGAPSPAIYGQQNGGGFVNQYPMAANYYTAPPPPPTTRLPTPSPTQPPHPMTFGTDGDDYDYFGFGDDEFSSQFGAVPVSQPTSPSAPIPAANNYNIGSQYAPIGQIQTGFEAQNGGRLPPNVVAEANYYTAPPPPPQTRPPTPPPTQPMESGTDGDDFDYFGFGDDDDFGQFGGSPVSLPTFPGDTMPAANNYNSESQYTSDGQFPSEVLPQNSGGFPTNAGSQFPAPVNYNTPPPPPPTQPPPPPTQPPTSPSEEDFSFGSFGSFGSDYYGDFGDFGNTAKNTATGTNVGPPVTSGFGDDADFDDESGFLEDFDSEPVANTAAPFAPVPANKYPTNANQRPINNAPSNAPPATSNSHPAPFWPAAAPAGFVPAVNPFVPKSNVAPTLTPYNNNAGAAPSLFGSNTGRNFNSGTFQPVPTYRPTFFANTTPEPEDDNFDDFDSFFGIDDDDDIFGGEDDSSTSTFGTQQPVYPMNQNNNYNVNRNNMGSNRNQYNNRNSNYRKQNNRNTNFNRQSNTGTGSGRSNTNSVDPTVNQNENINKFGNRRNINNFNNNRINNGFSNNNGNYFVDHSNARNSRFGNANRNSGYNNQNTRNLLQSSSTNSNNNYNQNSNNRNQRINQPNNNHKNRNNNYGNRNNYNINNRNFRNRNYNWRNNVNQQNSNNLNTASNSGNQDINFDQMQ